MRKSFRQGDVLLIPVDKVKGNRLSHLILARGEATGHKHQITAGEAIMYENVGVLYLKVVSHTATLTHEEHRLIQIPQGSWLVRIQREYDPHSEDSDYNPTGWRYVAD